MSTAAKVEKSATDLKSSDESTNNNHKRKSLNDDNSNESSNSSSNGTEANTTTHKPSDSTLKKLKIPLRLAATSTTTKDDIKLVPKLPTGVLASGKVPSAAQPTLAVKKVSEKVADVFGSSDEDEVVEMPPEAKMRMRNRGRDTPTSTGPNSFGKTNMGFCDQRKLFEKQLREKAEELVRKEEEERSKANKK